MSTWSKDELGKIAQADDLHISHSVRTGGRTTRGAAEEKAPQGVSLQGSLFTQSGRRDLNPRPPEPHSGALPGCATSRLTAGPP